MDTTPPGSETASPGTS